MIFQRWTLGSGFCNTKPCYRSVGAPRVSLDVSWGKFKEHGPSRDISWVINPTAETLGIDICDGIKRWNRCIWWYLIIFIYYLFNLPLFYNLPCWWYLFIDTVFIFDLFNLPFLMSHVPISITWDHWSPRSHAMLRGRAAPAMMPAGGGSSWRCMMDQVIALCMMQWYIQYIIYIYILYTYYIHNIYILYTYHIHIIYILCTHIIYAYYILYICT